MEECISPNSDSKLSNCYVFKSRLQEYAQKVGFTTPVYETLKEGPSHQPSFRSTVIVNGIRYDSLTGFFNRKAAEQSAAEVALTELAKSGELKQSISQPVHETGLCKNLLQEYAQKMNYAIPTYECQGGASRYFCTVEIGGTQYIGAAAKSKKEAEIKAARTALLALQSSSARLDDETNDESPYTVFPSKRKQAEIEAIAKEKMEVSKRKKKARFEKKPLRRKREWNKSNRIPVANAGALGSSGNSVLTELQNTVYDSQTSHEVQVNNAGGLGDHAGHEVPLRQQENLASDAIILSDRIQVQSTGLLGSEILHQFSSEQIEYSVPDVQSLNEIRVETSGILNDSVAYQVGSIQTESTVSEQVENVGFLNSRPEGPFFSEQSSIVSETQLLHEVHARNASLGDNAYHEVPRQLRDESI